MNRILQSHRTFFASHVSRNESEQKMEELATSFKPATGIALIKLYERTATDVYKLGERLDRYVRLMFTFGVSTVVLGTGAGLYAMFSHSVTREEKLRKEFRDYGKEINEELKEYVKEVKEDLKEYIKESADANTRYILSEMRSEIRGIRSEIISEIRSLDIRLSSKTE
ncbi:hypothetical protein BDZ91DRAFT_711694 [Kalaharituber pfeilii]|nr:hypothetical protein BDZ91DRAFT_711694 [Kalaharituber pfeilii]